MTYIAVALIILFYYIPTIRELLKALDERDNRKCDLEPERYLESERNKV